MAKLAVLITRQHEKVDDVVAAWNSCGVEGATILDNHGVQSYLERVASFEVLPGMRSTLNTLVEEQKHAMLLLTVISNVEIVPSVIQATEEILGDLTGAATGFLFVIDVEWVSRKVLSMSR